MNKVEDVIGNMDAEELAELQDDLDDGTIQGLVEKRLREVQAIHDCPVCGKAVKDDAYRLEFGDGIRMEARFDELDCLQHFTEKLRASSSSTA